MTEYKRNKIYNRDCLAGLSDMIDNFVDVCFTSPPYNDRGGNNGKIGAHNTHQKYTVLESHKDDWLEWQISIIDELLRVSKRWVIYNVQGLSSNRENVYKLIGHYSNIIHDILIWTKTNSQPSGTPNVLNNNYEFIILLTCEGVKRVTCNSDMLWNSFILPQNRNTFSGFHGAVMSQSLSDMIIREFTNEGDLVLDPFFGLGTTAISCIKMKRDYIGFEICKEYVDMAKYRISDETSHRRLF